MGGGSSSPSEPAECVCGVRFCRYNRSDGIADPKTPSEPEALDAIDKTRDVVSKFMGDNCEALYKQAKDNLESSSDQTTEGTVTCLSTDDVYTRPTDNKDTFKTCYKRYKRARTNRISVCALVASIVALLLFFILMVFVCLYPAHRKTVTKPVNDDQSTEPLSSQ